MRAALRHLAGTVGGRVAVRQIQTLEAANQFLAGDWIGIHNRKFAVPAQQAGTAFLPYAGADLEKIFSLQHYRVVGNDNTVRFHNLTLQIESQTFRYSLARCEVLVCRHLDHTLSLHYGPHCLGRYDSAGKLLSAPVSARKRRTA